MPSRVVLTRIAATLLVAAGAQSCQCQVDEPPGNRPPLSPLDRELPEAVLEALPTTEDGLPVIAQTSFAGMEVQLAYDETLRDPIAMWGQCLQRVVDCYDANPGAPVAPCVELIERCPDDRGGEGCCPPSCIEAFRAARARGGDETSALLESIGRGDCVQGFDPDLVP